MDTKCVGPRFQVIFLVDGAQDSFTDSNFRVFFGLTLDVVLRPWEKLMVTFRFTEVCFE